MADVPEYSDVVILWEDIKEDIPALLSNPYVWLEGQLKIALARNSRPAIDRHFKTLLEIMNMLNNIHFHIHDE